MVERAIHMRSDLARMVRGGIKTQTRRPIKPQPPEDTFEVGIYSPLRVDKEGEYYPAHERFGIWAEEWDIPCPYGDPGDRLRIIESSCTVEISSIHVEREVWNELYGRGAWEHNEWIWAIEFKIVEKD